MHVMTLPHLSTTMPAIIQGDSARPRSALIIVDVQNDFLPPNGSLAVPWGLEVGPPIAELLDKYEWDMVIASQVSTEQLKHLMDYFNIFSRLTLQDYHPPGHISFATSHDKQPFEDMQLTDARGKAYVQKLWPEHCVQGTNGCEIKSELVLRLHAWGDKFKIVRKVSIPREPSCSFPLLADNMQGWHKGIESYSAFEGYVTSGTEPAAPPTTLSPALPTEVADTLRAAGITRVVVTGVATDFCVGATAQSSIDAKFDTAIVAPACRSIVDANGSKVYDKLAAQGAKIIGRDNGPWENEVRGWITYLDGRKQ